MGVEKIRTKIQSLKVKGLMLKILLNRGTYMIIECKSTDEMQAKIKSGLQNNPTLKILESSESAFKALSISIITKTDKLRVEALALP